MNVPSANSPDRQDWHGDTPSALRPNSSAMRSDCAEATVQRARRASMKDEKRWRRNSNRLTQLRSLARAAEADGMIRPAEFFWAEVADALSRLDRVSGTYVVTGPTGRLRSEPDSTASEQLTALARDLAFEHLSYYDAWRQTHSAHACRHLEMARSAAKRAHWTEQEAAGFIGGRTVQVINALLDHSKFEAAKRLAVQLTAELPNTIIYCTALASVHERAAMVPQANWGQKRSLRAVARALFELRKLRREHPHCLAFFESIGRLSLHKALLLEQARLIAEALAEVEASLAHSPGLDASVQVQARLTAQMQQLRVAAGEGSRQSASTTRAEQRVRDQAAKGFRLVEEYRRSDEVRMLAVDLPLARACDLWHRIGLGPVDDQDPRLRALEDAVSAVLSGAPADLSCLPSRWTQVSQDNPALRAVDTALVCSYLAGQLCDETAALDPAVGESGALPCSAPCIGIPRRNMEPLVPWLLSRRDFRIKVQLAAALVAALLVGLIVVDEARARNAREDSYAALVAARSRGDLVAMMDAAQQFLATSVRGRDERANTVLALYSEAFVRWYNSSTVEEKERQRRIAFYRERTQGAYNLRGKGQKDP